MSRQTDRAADRRQAKIDRADERVKSRLRARSKKGLQALSVEDAKGYPKSKPRRALRIKHTEPHSGGRQRTRYARQIAAGQLAMEGANNG